MASVNNDALAELLIAAVLILLLRYTRHPDPQPRQLLAIGGLLGLGFLSKGTVYLMAPVVAAAVLWQTWGRWPVFIRHGLQVFVPALLLGGLWWGRNIVVYGGLDFMGKSRHDAVVIGQIRTAEWIALYGPGGTVQRFVQTTFNSFWGQFGWMALPMLHPPWLYPLLWVLLGVAVFGVLLAPFVWSRGKTARHQRRGGGAGMAPDVPPLRLSISSLQLFLLFLLFLLTVGLHVGYNLTFVQHQGRYLFPALIPIATAMAVGWGTVFCLLARPWLPRFPWLPRLLPLGSGLALVALDLYALLRIIIPNLA